MKQRLGVWRRAEITRTCIEEQVCKREGRCKRTPREILDLGWQQHDRVHQGTDRQHAQALARKYQSSFRPIYTYLSDDKVWEQRLTARYLELNNPAVSTWEHVQRQRGHFHQWEPNTALFVDAIKPDEQNYQDVLSFVTAQDVAIKPLEDIPLVQGKYH